MADNSNWDLKGRTVVVTGASSGVGAAAARRFAEAGATVAVAGRSPERTAAVADGLGARPYVADYGSLDDVRALAGRLLEDHPRIDILVNNAGGVFSSWKASAEGYEMNLQVNHLAPFLLTQLLLDRLGEAPDGARVINTVSSGHRSAALDLEDLHSALGRFRGRRAYEAAKLAALITTGELSRRLRGTGVTATAFSPGPAAGDLFRDRPLARAMTHSRPARVLVATPAESARHLLRLASVQDAAAVDGAYFLRHRPGEIKHRQATDPALARSLWERSRFMTGLVVPPPVPELRG